MANTQALSRPMMSIMRMRFLQSWNGCGMPSLNLSLYVSATPKRPRKTPLGPRFGGVQQAYYHSCQSTPRVITMILNSGQQWIASSLRTLLPYEH